MDPPDRIRGLSRRDRGDAHLPVARLRARRRAGGVRRRRPRERARPSAGRGRRLQVGEARQGRVGLVELLRQQAHPRERGRQHQDLRALHRLRAAARRRVRDLRRGLVRAPQHLEVPPLGRRRAPHQVRQRARRGDHPLDGVGAGLWRGGPRGRALRQTRREGFQGGLHGPWRRRGRALPLEVRGELPQASHARRLPRRAPSDRHEQGVPQRAQL